jgi:hypothetical protein
MQSVAMHINILMSSAAFGLFGADELSPNTVLSCHIGIFMGTCCLALHSDTLAKLSYCVGD